MNHRGKFLWSWKPVLAWCILSVVLIVVLFDGTTQSGSHLAFGLAGTPGWCELQMSGPSFGCSAPETYWQMLAGLAVAGLASFLFILLLLEGKRR